MGTVIITKQLKMFCSALVSLYECVGDTSKDAEYDWWHAFDKNHDVNLFVERGRVSVWAYRYSNNLDTRSGVKVIDHQLKRRREA